MNWTIRTTPFASSPKKTLYLHIGLPKTGTTYVQNWLGVNRNWLAERQTWSPSRDIYAHRLAVEYITDTRRRSRSDAIEILKTPLHDAALELANWVKDSRFTSAVVSSEYFFETDPRVVAESLPRIGPVKLKIVMVLRRQDRLIESSYNQEVKAMGITEALPPPHYQPELDWLKLFERWSDAFGEGNIAVVNYDKAMKDRSLLFGFCRAIGLAAELECSDGLTEPEHRNESLPSDLLEFKRLVNAYPACNIEGWLLDAARAGIGGPPFRLRPELARQYLSHYTAQNATLARRLYGSDASNLFDIDDLDTAPDGDDATNGLTVEIVARLLAHLASSNIALLSAMSKRQDDMEKRLADLVK